MRKELLLVLCYFCLMLVGCSSDPYPDAPESVQGFVVPPYPGAAGRVGLDGVDSNNNGVRDDVERWILLEHGDKLDRRAIKMMFLKARVNQRTLHPTSSKEEAVELSVIQGEGLVLCMDVLAQSFGYDSYVTATSDEIDKSIRDISLGITDQVANTRERAQAYARYNGLIGGTAYDSVIGNRNLELKMEDIRKKWDKEDKVISEPLDVSKEDWTGF